MNVPKKIEYGSLIRLRHVATGTYLKSLNRLLCHPGTSQQQMVIASPEVSNETRWIIKSEDRKENVNLLAAAPLNS